MSLEGLRPSDMTEAVLQNLIAAQVPEGKTIDYKADLPGGSDGAKKDFLADLCSFANAAGGHLVFGMAEADGLPVNLDGLNGDIDQAMLRLESMARDGVRPPIPGLEFARVALANGKSALVANIPKSWNPPHQVILQKDFRFFARGSAGKQHSMWTSSAASFSSRRKSVNVSGSFALRALALCSVRARPFRFRGAPARCFTSCRSPPSASATRLISTPRKPIAPSL
jgi:predicted HTH transcriptional regulator